MKKEEYIKKLIEIRENQEKLERELKIEYAMANNPYKVGDIFEDHIGKIQIEIIKFTVMPFSEGIPQCKYFGIQFKKDGKPFKNGEKRWAYQMNQRQ
jgi:hypothetical protein